MALAQRGLLNFANPGEAIFSQEFETLDGSCSEPEDARLKEVAQQFDISFNHTDPKSLLGQAARMIVDEKSPELLPRAAVESIASFYETLHTELHEQILVFREHAPRTAPALKQIGTREYVLEDVEAAFGDIDPRLIQHTPTWYVGAFLFLFACSVVMLIDGIHDHNVDVFPAKCNPHSIASTGR
jgi:hypothetical protein